MNPKFNPKFLNSTSVTPPYYLHLSEELPAATSQLTAGDGIINTFPFGFN